MTYAQKGQRPHAIDQCRYDGSRLLFRGPARTLEGEFVACLGGTETFGKYIERPYPDLVEEITGVTCVNFGWPNAGTDVFANDSALIGCARRAKVCVLQVPCAVNMSNMYYRVHPRRNDRFLEASEALRVLFHEVDFVEYSFTRHMLGCLQALSPERFAYIRKELTTVWLTGMRSLIGRIGPPVVLLWLSNRAPEQSADCPDLAADPAFVDREMLEALRGEVQQIVELRLDAAAGAPLPGPAPGAAQALGAGAHQQAAEALVPVIAGLLQD